MTAGITPRLSVVRRHHFGWENCTSTSTLQVRAFEAKRTNHNSMSFRMVPSRILSSYKQRYRRTKISPRLNPWHPLTAGDDAGPGNRRQDSLRVFTETTAASGLNEIERTTGRQSDDTSRTSITQHWTVTQPNYVEVVLLAQTLAVVTIPRHGRRKQCTDSAAKQTIAVTRRW